MANESDKLPDDWVDVDDWQDVPINQGPDDWVDVTSSPQTDGHVWGAETQWQAIKDWGTSPLKSLGNLGVAIDEYTGAPVRKFITEQVTGQQLEKAPSGKEQAIMMGASDVPYDVPGIETGIDISPADVWGVGLETIQDPLLVGSKALKAIGKPAKAAAEWGAKKFGKIGFAVPEESTGRFLKNPQAVKQAPTATELAGTVLGQDKTDTGLLGQIGEKLKQASDDALGVLRSDSKIQTGEVLGKIKGLQDKLKTNGVLIGDAQKRTFGQLQEYADDLAQVGGEIDETTLGQLIRNLDENIDWVDRSKNLSNLSLSDVRRFVDAKLKTMNPAYKQQMLETEDAAKGYQLVKKAFQNRQDKESFNKFITSVKNLANKPEGADINRALNALEKHTGYNLKENVLNSQAKEMFAKREATHGARSTLMGTMAGGAVESLLDLPHGSVSTLGALTGFGMEKYSGPVFQKLLSGQIHAQQFAEKFVDTAYGPSLMGAALRGAKPLAAEIFVLSEKDPQFRQILQQKESAP